MQHLITINESCKGKHIIELNNLTTYQAAIKKLSTYINLMWLIHDDYGEIDAGKIIGMYQDFILNPVILDDNFNEIHDKSGRRRDIEVYKEIVGIRRKLDNFLPVYSCGKTECKKGARNLIYSAKKTEDGEIWKFEDYLCHDHQKPYENESGVFTATLKMSGIRNNERIPEGMGLREEVFRKILESAGYDGQEITTQFSKNFVLNLIERPAQQMSLFI